MHYVPINCTWILFRVHEICRRGPGVAAVPEQWLVQGLRAKSKVDAGTRKEINERQWG